MPTVEKLSWLDSLEAQGFILHPWRHQAYVARVFHSTTEARKFERGTVHGLVEYEAAGNELIVVALHNEERGNGDFLRAVQAFERIATITGLTLRVVQFQNRRLAFWFERRTGWTRAHNKQFSDHATFTTPARPHFHDMPLGLVRE